MKHYFLTLTILFLLFSEKPVAQEWSQSGSFDALVEQESLINIYQLHVTGERVFIACIKSDFTYALYYSDDNGSNWVETTLDSNTASSAVFATVDSDTIYNYGNDLFGNRALRKSVDGGASWSSQAADYTNFPVFFIPAHFSAIGDTLVLTSVTRNVGLLKSEDGGATWESFIEFDDNDFNKSIVRVQSYGSYFYLAAGTNGRGLFRSHRDSTSWEKIHSIDDIGSSVFDFDIDENGRMYFLTDSGIDFSDDFGETWETKTAEDLGITEEGLVTIMRVSGQNLILTQTGAKVYRINRDFSDTVTSIEEGLTEYAQETRILNLESNSTSAFALRNGIVDKLWVYNGGQTGVSKQEELEGVLSFTLDQNYPNPFNPSTSISFNLPKAGLVSLIVYNMLGQEVATLVNERKSTGLHTVRFDASSLSSGTYIYRLQSGSFTQTRKMMLIK
ncbi:MAG: T9SS type A sorting domain-containing protein [Balneolaceae bacterium]